MANSPLVQDTQLCPSHLYGSRMGTPISKITIHHQAGHLTAKQCKHIWMDHYDKHGWIASANYSVCDGVIGLLVDEKYKSNASSNGANDRAAITIEVANVRGAHYSTNVEDDWLVSEQDYRATVELCADICRRYNFRLNWTGDKNGSLTVHRMFTSTHCPGNYLYSKMGQLAKDVNARIEELEDENMTDEKFAELMARYQKNRGTLECSTSLKPGFEEATDKHITDGTRPRAFATRAEVAVMINNAIK